MLSSSINLAWIKIIVTYHVPASTMLSRSRFINFSTRNLLFEFLLLFLPF